MCFAVPCLCAENGATARLSLHLSAAISAGLPRFDQISPEATHREELSDRIALPPFVVEASRIPRISARDLLTKAGMDSLLRERYPGASFRGQDPTGNSHIPNYAALMYKDDVRLSRMAEFARVLDSMAVGGDLAGAKELKAELQKVFLRKHDWRTEGMDKSVNHWRR
jgi:hypothetical protein